MILLKKAGQSFRRAVEWVRGNAAKEQRIEELRHQVLRLQALKELTKVEGWKIYADTLNARVEELRVSLEESDQDAKEIRARIDEIRKLQKITSTADQQFNQAQDELTELVNDEN